MAYNLENNLKAYNLEKFPEESLIGRTFFSVSFGRIEQRKRGAITRIYM